MYGTNRVDAKHKTVVYRNQYFLLDEFIILKKQQQKKKPTKQQTKHELSKLPKLKNVIIHNIMTSSTYIDRRENDIAKAEIRRQKDV